MQITSGVSHEHPVGRSWGNSLAFTSSQDLASTGNTTRQVFNFNLAYHDCVAGTTNPTTQCPIPARDPIAQLTFGPGSPDNPSISQVPKVAGQRQWVIFDAFGSYAAGGLTPLPGVAGTKRQIFKLDVTDGVPSTLLRITAAGDGDSERPSVNSGGGIFAFETTAKTLGDRPNPSGARQVYIFDDATGGGLKRVSFARNLCGAGGTDPCQAVGRSSSPSINENGREIVFESTSDLLGDGHDTGVPQIYYAKYDRGASREITLWRVTSGNGASRNPVIAEGGKLVVFETVATDVPGSPTATAGTRVVIADVSNPDAPAFIHISRPDVHGDCHWPVLNPKADDAPGDQGPNALDARVAMVCTGDPLQNETTGNRVFVYATKDDTLYQLTGSGDVQGPLGGNLGRWFVSFASNGNLTNTAGCGYQIYALNYNIETNDLVENPWRPATAIGELPPDAITSGSTTIGRQNFEVVPGSAAGGSTVTVTTRDGVVTEPVLDPVVIGLDVGAPNGQTGEAAVTIDKTRFALPPVPIANGWALCFAAKANGAGTLDCNGGKTGGDVTASLDHYTNDSDPACIFGCRENDAVCQGPLGVGPHTIGGDPDCNDRFVREQPSGVYGNGGARLSIPVTYSLSLHAGPDLRFCTADDTMSAAQNIETSLSLLTGSAQGLILDRDNELGIPLGTTDTGSTFSCNDMRLGNLGGARLVGAVPILDFPGLFGGMRDVIVGFDLLAARGAPTECGASCNTSSDCDDGNPCNGDEFCGTNQLCAPGTPPACDDGDPCNGAESCDPQQGCVAGVPCNDGDYCNGIETCDKEDTGGQCIPGQAVVCDNQDVCDGLERCEPASGLCLAGTPLACDDGNECTTELGCDPTSGCLYDPITGGGCNDDSPCTLGDTCSAGVCVGTPKVCGDNDGNVCTGVLVCNEADGNCEPGPGLSCSDGNACTADTCDAVTGCQFTPTPGAPCSDGDLCTGASGADTCDGSGACVSGTSVTCNDGDACTNDGVCNPATGQCPAKTPVVCDDNDTCTVDSCHSQIGCQFTVRNDGETCNDGNACTGPGGDPDQCIAGDCEPGQLVVCDDGNACTIDGSCDPASGCPAKTPRDCDDHNPCTDDSCDPALGCVHVNNTNPCSDGNACTGTGDDPDQCNLGGCEPGAPVTCDDGDICDGVETCNPASGCQAGPAPTCDDGNPCTSDACTDGHCVHPALDGAPCNDGNACTTNDTCAADVCAGTQVSCDDGDVCDGSESCDPLTGVCRAGTPLDCDDGDECTLDLTCDAVAGCGHERKPNYVVCRIEALITQVRSFSPGDVGGRQRQIALLKRLSGARKRAEMGLIGSGGRAVKNLRRAEKRIQSFITLVQTGVLRGRIASSRGRLLTDTARDTQAEIVTVMRTRR